MITKEFLEKRPLSNSSLKAFAISPAHYIHYLNAPREDKAAYVYGNVVDCKLLTPDEFDSRFVLMPKFDRRTTIGKAAAQSFELTNFGKTWVPEDIMQEAEYLVSAIRNNEPANGKIMQVTQTQRKINWIDKETGLPMVAILDMEADMFAADLKTTADASPEGFGKSVMNFGYHIQAAIYLDALAHRGKFVDFYFIAAEKSAPYGISVFKADQDMIKLGKQEYRKLLQEFKYCMDENLWHQTYEFRSAVGYHQLGIPGWAKAKLND